MATETKHIVDRAWSFAHILRDEGLSYLAYIEQITFLLFLKMADEISSRDASRLPLIPHKWGWASLTERTGTDLLEHYEAVLDRLSRQPGMLGAIFRKPRPEIENPRTLRRLIVDLVGGEEWSSLQADVKGDVYEGLLARTASESPKGAGQYFTPRGLISAIVDCVRPDATDTVCDPAAGTGGFLLAALDNAKRGVKNNDALARKHLAKNFVRGWELVPNTARLCVMNLYLHGVDADPSPIRAGVDALSDLADRKFSVVLTNPPFGTKGSLKSADEEKDADADDYRDIHARTDLWVATANKQLNFLQHAVTLLQPGGRCAIVVPDNVLFEAGAGESIRRKLIQNCYVHTLLRLPPGIFYAQGVKANVLFFDNKPAPKGSALWVYDLRTGKHFTLRQRQIKRRDFDEFIELYADGTHKTRASSWQASNQSSRWRPFPYETLVSREKVGLDILWLREEGVSASVASLPSPTELADTISLELRSALKHFDSVKRRLK